MMANTKTDHFTEHLIASEEQEKRRAARQATRDHEVIRKWADARGAQPASTARADDRGVGVLRLDLPGGRESRQTKRIDWNDWFRAFDERGLCFVYEEQKLDGMRSDFFRLELAG
jgi:hypothetical protein